MRKWTPRSTLNRWLKRNGIMARWLARRCHLSDSAMSMIRAGQRLPTQAQAAAMHAATGGEVPLSWE